MTKLETKATVHYCDGCGSSHIQLADDDLPSGFYVDVMEVHLMGAENGRLFVCAVKCLIPAFKRRHEVWDGTTARDQP